LDAAVTAQALPLAVVGAVADAVAGAGVAVGVDVAVGVSVDALVIVAEPPQATSATVVIKSRSALAMFIVGVACTNQTLGG